MKEMLAIGIDIGSTCAKLAVLEGETLCFHRVIPTGWNSVDTAQLLREQLLAAGYDVEKLPTVATGYGRVAVPYAHKAVTEITCHGKGAARLFHMQQGTVVDIGGQDTKIIAINNGDVVDFLMNDKCSAGTGRFLEVMARTLGIDPGELCDLARSGGGISITSMCTVFAESEIISLVGQGTPKKDIAFGVVDSIAKKVQSQFGCIQHPGGAVYLTGGLCESSYLLERIGQLLGRPVLSNPLARFAGAIGAACIGQGLTI